MNEDYRRRLIWQSAIVFCLFCTTSIVFAAITDNAWEDYYITFRASKNLAFGPGLQFTAGERVHSFTSPLGTLLPAACSKIAGPDRDELAFWLFRILSATFFGGSGVLLFLTARHLNLPTLSVPVLVGFIALDSKSVVFASNGMETGIMLFFLSLEVHVLTVFYRRTSWLLGLSWAGLMWSRPDGFIYGGAISIAYLIFSVGVANHVGGRRGLIFIYLKSLAIALLLYSPWFIWAWSYYGTAIPNTIIAKGLRTQTPVKLLVDGVHKLALAWRSAITFDNPSFAPPYLVLGGWSKEVRLFSSLLFLVTFSIILLPWTSRLTKAFALAFLATNVYLFSLSPYPYPWYLPLCTWFGYVALGLAASETFYAVPRARVVIAGAMFATILAQFTVLTRVVEQLAFQEREIERGLRQEIGLWLKANAGSQKDTVFLEPLGYIGYYSNLKMYDYPGLSSPEVIDARRRLKTDSWSSLIADLRPDWLVLRPGEINALKNESDVLVNNYQLMKVFDASAKVARYRGEGKGFISYDQTFSVFHRNDSISPSTQKPNS